MARRCDLARFFVSLTFKENFNWKLISTFAAMNITKS